MVITKTPYRRTLDFLEDFPYKFKPFVKVLTIFVNDTQSSKGTKWRFVVNYIPKISYSHPHIQISTMRQSMYGPYIRIFYEDGSETLCDTADLDSDGIMKHLGQMIGVKKEEENTPTTAYIPNFGYDCRYFCICQRPGQIPCSRHKKPLGSVHSSK